MNFTKVVTTTRRLETRIKAASIRTANMKAYSNKIINLGLSQYAVGFSDVYDAAAALAVRESLRSDEWNTEDFGGKLVEDGSFISDQESPYGDPQDSAEVTVEFTVKTYEWVDVATEVTVEILPMLARVAGRDKKALSAFLKDSAVRDYILSWVVSEVDDLASSKSMPRGVMTDLAKLNKYDESDIKHDGSPDEDISEHWELSYIAEDDMTVAPRPSISHQGEITLGLMCRLTAKVQTDHESAGSTRNQPSWYKKRNWR